MLSMDLQPGTGTAFRSITFSSLNLSIRPTKAFVRLLKHRNIIPQYPSRSLDTKSVAINVQARHDSGSSETCNTESSTNYYYIQENKKFAKEKVKPETARITANFSPDIWGDVFSSFSLDNQMIETYTEEIEGLKEEVRSMLLATDSQPRERIILINNLEYLGLSYHFEKEIEDQLQKMFASYTDFEVDDLYIVALAFRVFRQHGHYVPCGVFDKFIDDNGKLKETLKNDIKGMLSLYEASHLRTHGETTLEEALTFTTAHLNSILPQLNPNLAKQVKHSLVQPFHKGMQKIEARYYISVYQENKCVNETMLRFAKIDFNFGQLLYKQELNELKRWWKELSIKLGFSRDRLVEYYFFVFALIYEPCYSHGRIALTKATAILTIIDDTYDSYGTLEELKTFTDAVKRWDSNATHQLPDYLQITYKTLFNFTQDVENEMIKQGRSYCAHLAKVVFEDVVEAQLTDAKWFLGGHIPPFDEYMSNCVLTCYYRLFSCLCFMFVGAIADAKAFEWLQSMPKILRGAETFCRVLDDIRDYEEEKERGRLLSSISCYMKEHGVPKEEAINALHKMLEDAWKDANEGCLKPNPIPMNLLVRMVNLFRAIEVIHKHGDGFNHPEQSLLKNHITSMFIDPIPT